MNVCRASDPFLDNTFCECKIFLSIPEYFLRFITLFGQIVQAIVNSPEATHITNQSSSQNIFILFATVFQIHKIIYCFYLVTQLKICIGR